MVKKQVWRSVHPSPFAVYLSLIFLFLKKKISLRARHVNMRFLRILGHGECVFKDSVRLIARFYSRSEYDKPLEC